MSTFDTPQTNGHMYTRVSMLNGSSGSYSMDSENEASLRVGTSGETVKMFPNPPGYIQYRGAFQGELSGLSSGALIQQAVLSLYINTPAANDSAVIYVDPCSAQEHDQSVASALWGIVQPGTPYASASGLTSAGAVDINLGGTALADIQNAISDGWFTLGLSGDAAAGDSVVFAGAGDSTQAHRPKLTLTYIIPGQIKTKITMAIGVGLSAVVGIASTVRMPV